MRRRLSIGSRNCTRPVRSGRRWPTLLSCPCASRHSPRRTRKHHRQYDFRVMYQNSQVDRSRRWRALYHNYGSFGRAVICDTRTRLPQINKSAVIIIHRVRGRTVVVLSRRINNNVLCRRL